MNLRLVAYEDAGWQQLLPLVYTRTACQLVCGMGPLLDKIRRLAGFAPEIWCRSYLAGVVAADTGLPTNQRLDRSALLLNGRALWSALPPVESGESSWVGYQWIRSTDRLPFCGCVPGGANYSRVAAGPGAKSRHPGGTAAP